MRVAWIGPYDVTSVAHRMDQPFAVPFHPATWIRNAALAFADHPDVELHVLMHHKQFVRDYRFVEQGIHFHLFRAPLPMIPRPLVLYQLDRWKFYRELQNIKPDIVHGHGTENLFSYVAVTSGYPNVVSIQAIISLLLKQYRRLSRRAFEHFLVQFVERLTVRRGKNFIIKAPFAEEFIRRLNPSARIFLLENIIHEAFFGVERRNGNGGKKIIFVGTLINTKGVEELVRAFHEIVSDHADLELHLIGTGTESYVRNVLRPLINRGTGRIVLRGQLSSDQLAAELKDAAMLILPSYFETSPNVVAEAMVAGTPVIGTDVGGIPFMIKHGETGQIVPVRNVSRLAEAMKTYVDVPEVAEQYAERAKQAARSRYGKQRYVETLLEIYRSVLDHEPPGAK